MDSSYHADQSISDRISRRNSSDEWFMIDSTMSSESHHIAGSVLGDPFRGHARHRRRRFDPQERAEIAAVRKVGACTNCRSRKVKVLLWLFTFLQNLANLAFAVYPCRQRKLPVFGRYGSQWSSLSRNRIFGHSKPQQFDFGDLRREQRDARLCDAGEIYWRGGK